ncbi:protein of unknown function [Candidatus Promineifilum breve]|uniref:Uncharacterized protein n=1 Tax=Candidatus Promineifilum breve TaxID=1806508 RepID=A0A160T615_9CHLR|nr:protein of unknown function [Candidatus Promineifilum breve]
MSGIRYDLSNASTHRGVAGGEPPEPKGIGLRHGAGRGRLKRRARDTSGPFTGRCSLAPRL